MKFVFQGSVVFMSLLAGIPNLGFGRMPRDPRLAQIADRLEKGDFAPLFTEVSATDWTKSVLQSLSNSDRTHLAKIVRHATARTIRDGHREQFRVVWRSPDLPDSEFVVTFLMDARPGDLTRPLIAFSSRVDKVPEILAEAIEENLMPLVLSFYDPINPWVQSLPKMSDAERKNMARFYRSLKVLEIQPEERLYTGTRMDPNGIIRQDEFKLHLNSEGRWVVE